LKVGVPSHGDFIAGLSVAGLLLPEAVAYAGIAGLSPARAIFAAIAGCLAYVLIGRSRFAIVSPTSSSAAILAAALAALHESANDPGQIATLVVLISGICFVAASTLRLGALTGFISRPVLRGFAFGLAITIVVKQLPTIVGVPVPTGNFFDLLIGLGIAFPRWSMLSVALGSAALALLLALRRIPKLPGALVVLALGVGVSAAMRLPGVTLVGPINMTLTQPALPPYSWELYSRVVQFTLPLVLILFAESWGTMRALALRHGDSLVAGRELGALGLANLASAAVSGMPVGAGFSVGNASEGAGAASRATAVAAALGLALLIAAAGPLVARLPAPVLAAVVVAALVHALDPAPIVQLWRLRRDAVVALSAASAVLAFGVLNGMLIAIVLSLAAFLRRFATPNVARLGRLGTSHDYVDIQRHPEAVAPSGIVIWRAAEPLFFANAERVFAAITTGSRDCHLVIVSLEESADLDSTALEALIEFDASAAKRGVRVQLARAHDRVRDLLTRAGADELAARTSFSVDDAVDAVRGPGGPYRVEPEP